MTQHTLGPWEIVETAKANAPTDAWFELLAANRSLVLAEVYTDDDGADDKGVDVATARANAALIAAAPELLEALTKIDNQVSHGKMGDWSIALTETRRIARAAIAKAHGDELPVPVWARGDA